MAPCSYVNDAAGDDIASLLLIKVNSAVEFYSELDVAFLVRPLTHFLFSLSYYTAQGNSDESQRQQSVEQEERHQAFQ